MFGCVMTHYIQSLYYLCQSHSWFQSHIMQISHLITIQIDFYPNSDHLLKKGTCSSLKTQDFRGCLDKSLKCLIENLSKARKKIFYAFLILQQLLLTITTKIPLSQPQLNSLLSHIFMICNIFNILDSKELCREKSLWQSFKIKKSEMTVSKYFPVAPSWCTPFFFRRCFHGEMCEIKLTLFYFLGNPENNCYWARSFSP